MSTLDLTIAFDKNQKNAQDVLAQIKEFCNSDASLDDRWMMYLKIESSLETTEILDTVKNSSEPYNCENEYSPYDDFGMDGNETQEFSEMVGFLEMNLGSKVTEKEVVEFKEYVLKSGFGSYKWDC